MELKLIGRGMLAGGLGGLLAFVFARIFAEPLIQQAIDYEEERTHAQEALDKAAGVAVGGHEHELFSRTVQGVFGLGAGMILFGVVVGALFAVAYAVCIGRTGNVRPRPLALLVGAAGFVGFFLVPFLKYPASPPAVGHEETVAQRTALFLIMLACSVLFLFLAVYVGQKLNARFGTWRAATYAGAGYLLAIGVLMLLLPNLGDLAVNVREYGRQTSETPQPLLDADGNIAFPGFDPDLLYSFRLYAVGAQLILWTTIALVFAPLAERLLRPLTTEGRRELAGSGVPQ